jgi:hypothetical protein
MIRISFFNRGLWHNSECRPMRHWKGTGEIAHKALTLKDLNGNRFQVSPISEAAAVLYSPAIHLQPLNVLTQHIGMGVEQGIT